MRVEQHEGLHDLPKTRQALPVVRPQR
jgi:hypothetical protein